MAVLLNQGDELTRSGTYLNPATSWTLAFWLKQARTAPTTFRTIWTWGDLTFSTSYLYVGSSFQTNDVLIETYNGVTTTDSPSGFPETEVWTYLSLVYDSTATTLTLRLNDTITGKTTVDLSTFTFATKDETLGFDTDPNDYSIGYMRLWQRALTQNELVKERYASVAFSTESLLADTPLLDRTHLTDVSGNSHNWTESGHVTTTPGPVLPNQAHTLFAISGTGTGLNLTSAIISTPNGTVWTNLTAELPESNKTLQPIVGIEIL